MLAKRKRRANNKPYTNAAAAVLLQCEKKICWVAIIAGFTIQSFGDGVLVVNQGTKRKKPKMYNRWRRETPQLASHFLNCTGNICASSIRTLTKPSSMEEALQYPGLQQVVPSVSLPSTSRNIDTQRLVFQNTNNNSMHLINQTSGDNSVNCLTILLYQRDAKKEQKMKWGPLVACLAVPTRISLLYLNFT